MARTLRASRGGQLAQHRRRRQHLRAAAQRRGAGRIGRVEYGHVVRPPARTAGPRRTCRSAGIRGRSAAASTAVRSRTEMTILSGQTLRTCADCTSVMRSTRRATIAALIRMSGVPGRIPASAITSAREMPAGPVTCDRAHDEELGAEQRPGHPGQDRHRGEHEEGGLPRIRPAPPPGAGSGAIRSGSDRRDGTRPGSTSPGSTRPGGTSPGSTRPGGTRPGGRRHIATRRCRRPDGPAPDHQEPPSLRCSAATISGPSAVTSPAPMVSTRSPGLARPAAAAGTSAAVGQVERAAGDGRRDQVPGHAGLRDLPWPRTRRARSPHRQGRARRRTRRRTAGTAVQVRLEDRDDPAAGRHVPGGREVGGQLGRVVRVAVEHPDPVRLALQLHPAASAAVAGQAADGAAQPGSRARSRRPARPRRSAHCAGRAPGSRRPVRRGRWPRPAVPA